MPLDQQTTARLNRFMQMDEFSKLDAKTQNRLRSFIGQTDKPQTTGVFGKVNVDDFQKGERNIVGNVFERPGSAFRNAILNIGPTGKSPVQAFKEGSVNPTNVPRFQNLGLDKFFGATDPIIDKATEVNPLLGKAARAGRDVAGFGVSAAGLVGDVVTNPADAGLLLAGKVPTGGGINLGARAAQTIGKTKPAQALSRFGTKQRQIPVPKFLQEKATRVTNFIKDGIVKGIRPSVTGTRTATQSQRYFNQADDAVKTIVENKKILKFADDTGQQVNRLPESLDDFSQSIEQTKSFIYSQYDDLLTKSGQKGAAVDLKAIAKEMDILSKNEVISLKNPSAVKYAQEVRDRFLAQGKMGVKNADNLIKSYNADLKSYYKNPQYGSAQQVTIDAMIANNLRKALDKTVSGATGKQFQALKNQYGSLTAIEKDVNRRSIVDARKNIKGLIDFTDIFSAGDVINGVASLNPALIAKGATQFALKSYFKKRFGPNNIIKNMFKKVDGLHSPRIKPITPEILDPGVRVPPGGPPGLPGPGTRALPNLPVAGQGVRNVGQQPIITPNVQGQGVIPGQPPIGSSLVPVSGPQLSPRSANPIFLNEAQLRARRPNGRRIRGRAGVRAKIIIEK